MTTTAEAIRDHVISLILAIVPTSHSGDRFTKFANEDAADLFLWAREHPEGCFRTVQVRNVRTQRPPDVTTSSVETPLLPLQIAIAYPHSARTGPANALDRDDVMREDQIAIEAAVGLTGYANFDGSGGNPQAEWVGGAAARTSAPGVDFLVIRQTMRYRREAVLW